MFDQTILKNNIHEHMSGHIAAGDYFGAVARVYHQDNLIYEEYQGVADPEKGTKMSPTTTFRMASMTKPVTAVAVLQAQEMGLLSVFDSVSRYIPEYKDVFVAARDENGKLVPGERADLKIYQLLNHTCGIMGGFPMAANGKLYPSPGDEQWPLLTEDLRPDVATAVLNYPKFLIGYVPGTKSGYCSYAGCDICADIVSRVAGIPFEEFYQKYIFDPLGMNDTTFTPTKEQWERMAAMHMKVNGKPVARDMEGHIFEKFALTYHAAGAGLVSTTEDYTKFMLMLANNGEYEGKRLLSEDSITLMRFPMVANGIYGACATWSWGLGVRVSRNDPVLPNGCYGWSGAYGTHYWVDPTNDIAVIFMKNSCFDGGGDAFTSREIERDVMSAWK